MLLYLSDASFPATTNGFVFSGFVMGSNARAEPSTNGAMSSKVSARAATISLSRPLLSLIAVQIVETQFKSDVHQDFC